ncbi:MAG: NADH-quinone oxidoreductase subunit J, partial [Fimbriimonadaceae bacterium]|nr:NADH-quinone oxidoreductase subunit J [Fimbriimonadaceae bacterium]
AEKRPSRRVLGAAVALPLLFTAAALGAAMIATQIPRSDTIRFGAFQHGGPASIGRELFTRYLLPFEVTSILILIAILGAVVLARKEL